MERQRPSDAPQTYDRLAARFEAHARTAVWNALYDRPAVLEVLGPVAGLHVLDAGCGPGLYAEELVGRGAHVTAFDASAEMVALAGRRVGGRADLRRHDLNEPLHFLGDTSLDRVVCALVWHYVDQRIGALREFRRVLRPDGAVVISCDHPTADWLASGGSYFAIEPKTERWPSLDAEITSWRFPITTLCEEFSEAGFVIERVVEPRPIAEAAVVDPEEYQKLTTEPGFIVFRLRPTGGG